MQLIIRQGWNYRYNEGHSNDVARRSATRYSWIQQLMKKDSYKACSVVPVRDARDEENERQGSKSRDQGRYKKYTNLSSLLLLGGLLSGLRHCKKEGG